MTPELEEGLRRYMANRHRQDISRVVAVFGAMTPREQKLVREVAVMAGVRATMRAGSREQVPPDGEVLFDAISACLHMDDLYPTVRRMERLAQRRANRSTQEGGLSSD